MRIGADFRPRLISALVLAPLVLAVCLWGHWPFTLVVLITALLVFWEWLTVIGAKPKRALLIVGSLALIGAVLMLAIRPLSAASALVIVGMVAVALIARGGRRLRLWTPFGVLYAAALALPALMLRAEPVIGLLSIVWLFAVVWSTDIAAYFCGRLIGGPKLWPRVSPNKTWSGAIGGAVFGMAAGMLTLYVGGLSSALLAAPAAFLASVVSQAGDLFESSMKRRFGVKDSSALIPGHGGLMDRLDGFIAAGAFALALGLLRDPTAPALGLLAW
ncbi:phosphatidate cytidylyltransferase [Ancylobacter sp. WKF20]|uniref:phosphatidate cytidylyltransferase n=1 Tax=Ancylobacter sp. WKF20 TaxID=3039801 RepID=UPI0024342A0C|nr:phosphatidate cytidylyltransferase [Ancylobacter sp. WKF20]WGD31440.1 phosphatidate cytidylyltransferase [Ancylobacter sp. WKF20]